jgi:hypothetical protein
MLLMPTPETCPNCGAEVPPRARACPQCGSCDATGWSEEASAAGLGLPEEEFDYEDYTRREFGGGGRAPRGILRFWWLLAILVVILILVLALK